MSNVTTTHDARKLDGQKAEEYAISTSSHIRRE